MKQAKFYTVLSRSRELIHIVINDGIKWSCTCEDYTYQKNPNCYHILCAKSGRGRESTVEQVNQIFKNNRILFKRKKENAENNTSRNARKNA